jgi:hypothetical protein
MKRIKWLVLVLVLFIIPIVHAASGSISIAGPNQVVSGKNYTATVTISSNTKMVSWQMNLNYDKSYLQLVSTNSESGGTMMASSSASGVSKQSYKFTFKALKTGKTTLSITGASAIDYNNPTEAGRISLSTGSKSISIITQEQLEASYSKDNNLKSLSVEGFTITPSFSKEVLDYSVVVPENTKTIKIIASASDSKSSISGTGEKEVTSGSNAFDIVVKAENGSEKTYKLKVEVKDNNPIEVKVDGETYTVVKYKEYLTQPNDFEETTVRINDVEIPAYKNENIDIILVGLKDSEGNISLYSYDNGTYSKYVSLKSFAVSIMPLETNDVPKHYSKHSETIDGAKVTVYKYNQASRYSLIYGIDLASGEKGFFMYDSKLKTLIAYNTEMIDQLQSQNQLFIYLIIGFAIILVILFIIVIKMSGNKKKLIKELETKHKRKHKKEEEMIEL